jgi:hypothetical protein
MMMMRITFLVALMAFSVQAFTILPTQQKVRSAVLLRMSSETHIDRDYTASEGMNHDSIPTLIHHLKEDNFVESLEMMEPLFMNECVGEEYDQYMTQLKMKCAELGKQLPEGYAPNHP